MIRNPRLVLTLVLSSPGKFGIAVISPPLDDDDNRIRAQKAIIETRSRTSAGGGLSPGTWIHGWQKPKPPR
jgi:hypothetical protein